MDGEPIERNNFRKRVWLPATRATRMRGPRFRDLRHTAGLWPPIPAPGRRLRTRARMRRYAIPSPGDDYLHRTRIGCPPEDLIGADHVLKAKMVGAECAGIYLM